AGYLLFQVPGTALIERFGVRLSIACIIAVWGAISAATAFVHTAMAFYVLRFLLGVAEAGFFPAMIFYLTLWFPSSARALVTAAFACAIPLSGIVGGPLSTTILQLNGFVGLHGWQWLFLIEGLPACLLAWAVLKWLPNGPAQAQWLTLQERSAIAAQLADEIAGEDHDLSA